MFYGTTPTIISQYLYKELREIQPKRIFIPFAGNFVLEQVAYQACPDADIFSTDVMIYSNAIGFGLTNQDFRLEIRDDYREDFKYLAGKKKPIEKAAITIFFTEVSRSLNKQHHQYYVAQYKDAIQNQEQYFKDILRKLESVKENLRFNYFGYDAMKLISQVKKGDELRSSCAPD